MITAALLTAFLIAIVAAAGPKGRILKARNARARTLTAPHTPKD